MYRPVRGADGGRPALCSRLAPKHRLLCMEEAMDSASGLVSPTYFISPDDLWHLIGTAHTPQIIDTRRREIHDAAPGLIPGAVWRDVTDIERWRNDIDRNRPVVFACRY